MSRCPAGDVIGIWLLSKTIIPGARRGPRRTFAFGFNSKSFSQLLCLLLKIVLLFKLVPLLLPPPLHPVIDMVGTTRLCGVTSLNGFWSSGVDVDVDVLHSWNCCRKLFCCSAVSSGSLVFCSSWPQKITSSSSDSNATFSLWHVFSCSWNFKPKKFALNIRFQLGVYFFECINRRATAVRV